MVILAGQWFTDSRNTPELYQLQDAAFFALPNCHQLIDLDQPDTLLLDAALFQATNEARRAFKLPIFNYDPSLDKAARHHAQSMIRYDFYGHQNLYQLAAINPLKRIENHTKHFYQIAENIGQYQTINTAEWYGVRFNSRSKRYEYLDAESQALYKPFSYAQYARYAVQQWLNSAHHRANLLNPYFTHVGCAGRLSVKPFQQPRAPFGRVVQNFGCARVLTQDRR
ncbi:CAP domain-containing protein [Spirosoma flavus]